MVEDARLRKSDDIGRQSRAMTDRPVTESRMLSEDDRVAAFRQSFFQNALPDLPPIPGFHLIWLSTMSDRDPIHARLRLGYELVRAEEIPGWEHASIKTGEYHGCIGVNEMVAAKLPESLYQRFMAINHNDEPNKEAAKLTEVAERIREQARRKGAEVEIEDGIAQLRENRRTPVFA